VEEIVRLRIPARPVFVGVARTVVVSAATTIADLDDERLEDLRIAVSEACTNAVEAHQERGADDSVVLRCMLDDDRFEVHIEDRGAGLDSSELSDRRDLQSMAASAAERGWGIQLIRALVDDVKFVSRGGGTAVHLVIRRAEGVRA
jgi:serine/threonine-protein kinase RsbW